MHLLFQPGQAQMLQNQPQEQSDVQYPVSKKATTLHELQSTCRWSNSPTPTCRHIKSSWHSKLSERGLAILGVIDVNTLREVHKQGQGGSFFISFL